MTKAQSVAASKARRTPQWPLRTLTSADGEYILWHVLQHIEAREEQNYGVASAIYHLLATFRKEY